MLALGTVAQAATRMSDLAPADEYFGRAHMSPIEVSNRIRHAQDAARRGRGEVRRDAGMLFLTQDAVEAWSRRFPRDPWVAKDERKLAPLFASLRTSDGDAGARRCNVVLARVGSPQVVASASHAKHGKSAKKKHHRFLGMI